MSTFERNSIVAFQDALDTIDCAAREFLRNFHPSVLGKDVCPIGICLQDVNITSGTAADLGAPFRFSFQFGHTQWLTLVRAFAEVHHLDTEHRVPVQLSDGARASLVKYYGEAGAELLEQCFEFPSWVAVKTYPDDGWMRLSFEYRGQEYMCLCTVRDFVEEG